jgi:hypothetical protein
VDIKPDDTAFTDNTERAFELLQHDKDFRVTGALALGDAVFLPEAVRIASVNAELGGLAQPSAQSVGSQQPSGSAHGLCEARRERC